MTSTRYGLSRDELYFAMLPPAWGYVDQPPLVPLLARLLDASPALLRLPATLCAAGSVVLAGLLARELGGGRRVQAWTAWAYAGTTAVLLFGHVLLTATVDLVAWPLILLLVVRAVLRDRPRLWVAAGVVAGLTTYSKLLVAWLLVGLLVGLVAAGPRPVLRSPWPWLGGLTAALVGLPNLLFQVREGWPQLAMGRALAEGNAGEVRWFMWVFLVVVLGPPLVPVWLAGAVALWRSPLRFVVVAAGVVLALTFVSGTQPYYPTSVLPVLLAAGFVSLASWTRSRVLAGLLVVNAAVALVVSLPLLPAAVVGRTPVPAMNQLAADAIGWPAYVETVAAARAQAPADAVVLTSNYGEAGAVHRFLAVPVHSGHNALWDAGPPPETVTSAVVIGGQLPRLRPLFSACRVVARLDNGVGVDNEEQGQPVAVCTGLVRPWPVVWPAVRHLD